MLSRHQIILLKQAQHQAGLTDPDYREALAQYSGIEDCATSKDPRLGDENFDQLMSMFEAIYWLAVKKGTRADPIHLVGGNMDKFEKLPFRVKDYWKNKNTREQTSRDRANAMTQRAIEIERVRHGKA